jgi:hypothetical protein
MTTTEAIQVYLSSGGRITVLRPSLAPVCIPISTARRPPRRHLPSKSQQIAVDFLNDILYHKG